MLCGAIAGIPKYKEIKKEEIREEIYNEYDSLVIDDDAMINSFSKIISFGDSQGLTMNKDCDSFPELIRNKLKDTEKLLQAHTAYNNRAFDIPGLLENEVTLDDIFKMGEYSADFNYYKLGADFKFRNIYKHPHNKVFKDVLKEEDNSLIILSAGSNDVFHYGELDLAENNTPRLLRAARDLLFSINNKCDIVRNNIILDIRMILEINPNAKILVLGSYSPADNFFAKIGFSKLIDKTFKAAVDEFGDNVAFVDLAGVEKFVRPKDIHADPAGLKLTALKIITAANELTKNSKITKFTEKSELLYNTYLSNQDNYRQKNLSDEKLIEFRDFLENALNTDANYENYVEAISYLFVSKNVFDYDNGTFVRYGDFLELKDYFSSKYKDDLVFIKAFNYVLSSMKVSENTYYLRYPNAENRDGILYHQGNVPYAQETIALRLLKNKNDMHVRFEEIKHDVIPKGYVSPKR